MAAPSPTALAVLIADSGHDEDWGEQYAYWITVEVGDTRLEFQVREDEYSEFQPNDIGELTYQADKVLSFKRERQDEERKPEAAYEARRAGKRKDFFALKGERGEEGGRKRGDR